MTQDLERNISYSRLSIMSNKLKIFIILFCWSNFLHVFGQQREYDLSGSVIDSFTNELVDSCVVTVWNADSTNIVGKTYNAGWGYSVGVPASGEYIICYSHPRYQSYGRHIKLKFSRHRRPRITLDPIKLRKKPKVDNDVVMYGDLNEVVVTASKIKMVMRGDTIVYSADAFELSNGSMLDALVRMLPGVELRGSQIYVNGEFVDNLLVNGRNFFRGNPKIALDNLPAYMVDNVKVYRRESDSDVALGIQRLNNQDKELVMDVELKRIYSFGWSAHIDAGAGTDNRYRGKLFGMRFSNYSRSVAYMNSNNTNDATTPGTSGQWKSQYNLSVPSDYISAGLMQTIDDRQKRFTYEGEMSIDYHNKDMQTQQSAERFLGINNTFSRFRSTDDARTTHFVTKHKLEIKSPGSGYHLTLMPKVEFTKNSSNYSSWLAELSSPINERKNSIIDSIFFLTDRNFGQRSSLVSTQEISEHMNGHRWNYGLDAGVSFKVSELGDVLRIKLLGTFVNENSQDNGINSVRFHQSTKIADIFRNTQGIQDTKTANGTMNIDCPVTWDNVSGWIVSLIPTLTVNMEYKHAPRTIYFASDTVSQALQALDAINSYHSTQYGQIITPHIGFNLFRRLKTGHQVSISASTSVRIENAKLKYQRNMIDTCLTKLTSLAEPQFKVGYEKPNAWLLQFEYKMKQQAPELLNFIPYKDNTNPLIINQGGNSDIKGMLSHNVSLYYRNLDFRTRKMLLASIDAVFQPRQIARAIDYDPLTGIQNVSLRNMQGRNMLNGTINYRTPFTTKRRFYANASAMLYYSTSTEYVNHQRTVKTLMPSASLFVSYEKSHSRIEVGARTEYAHITSDETNFQSFDFFNMTYGFEGHTQLPYKIEFTLDAKMYTRRGYNDASMNADRFVVGSSLSRGFMSDRFLLRISLYDLLGKLDNVTRTVNAYGRTETWQNTLGRYAMLSIQYKFHKQPKKK